MKRIGISRQRPGDVGVQDLDLGAHFCLDRHPSRGAILAFCWLGVFKRAGTFGKGPRYTVSPPSIIIADIIP